MSLSGGTSGVVLKNPEIHAVSDGSKYVLTEMLPRRVKDGYEPLESKDSTSEKLKKTTGNHKKKRGKKKRRIV